ncbi:LytS/YhcK type 5TM receptor domain-containing protein [Jannaschia sp. M317]|uniref:LytS/YhcK type 5TM receptor domain-containing protein n=1 Tax=Jannaschia sp. M317 TaxID=2867011 RepID=UPI0021A386E1|nr:LytS/YhcK type 5TM receptor domain-containing protein [Jannaschia sp. M317]UWQ18897.1 hypothetical protein K3551_06340 [Jannaschia sp. M317]
MQSGIIFEYGAPIALLIGMAYGYGVMRRLLPGTDLAPQILGVLFGLVAVLQMNLPLEPVDGLIIDLRSVPVALAGAFLGLRGMLIALFIACATRISIGGVGWMAGVVGLMLAGGAGMLWDHLTRGGAQRPLRMMFGLAAMMSSHNLAVFFLPASMALWFLTNAAPFLLALNFLVVPVVALLMEKQRMLMMTEGRQRRSLARAGHRLFDSPELLAQRMAQADGSVDFPGGAEVWALRMRRSSTIATFWGPEAEGHVLGTLHSRLAEVLPTAGMVGLVRDDLILICVPRQSDQDRDDLCQAIRTQVGGTPIKVPGMAAVPVRFGVRHHIFDCVPTLPVAMERLDKGRGRIWRRKAHLMTGIEGLHAMPERVEPGTGRLFHIADRLLESEPARQGANGSDTV